MRSRVVTILAVLVTSAAALAVPPATATATATAAPDARAATVRLVTNGFGHGHGLSQYGAQAQALAGRSTQQILRFYYPSLANGTATGTMKVLLSADTTTDVVVLDRPGLRVRSLGNARTYRLDKPAAARRWRITPASGGRSTIAWKGARGSWHTARTVPGEAELSAGGQPVTLVTPSGRRAYRGALRSALPSAGARTRHTVNVVPLESYLRGVVPREVFPSWKPAALRAQAVAARTYAAFERADYSRRYFHVDDTTSSQVYGGVTNEVSSTDAAIKATARQVLTSGGRPAFTQFSASNGGWMSAGSQPYLVAKQDPYDDRYQGVTDSIAAGELERAFPAIGTFQRVEVVTRDGNGQWGGRVTLIRIVGSQTSTAVSGETFRSYFGLNSSWFDLR
ncbi:SpoIID/LytB domain-containing protein [Nocardioides sp.]|uniref:SpoIID/LytB domain-containing protein n=1 Tax=Nocardioides sp. TaxID=35761 RepID=UPI002726501D|nr:SpoIID/LytB domain-containing protein [Nocardioides sp.]MDO9456751.1 SpoIID/LytB domain-containing protein [Nocardioides sp.]